MCHDFHGIQMKKREKESICPQRDDWSEKSIDQYLFIVCKRWRLARESLADKRERNFSRIDVQAAKLQYLHFANKTLHGLQFPFSSLNSKQVKPSKNQQKRKFGF